jgi:hypothetical protein
MGVSFAKSCHFRRTLRAGLEAISEGLQRVANRGLANLPNHGRRDIFILGLLPRCAECRVRETLFIQLQSQLSQLCAG